VSYEPPYVKKYSKTPFSSSPICMYITPSIVVYSGLALPAPLKCTIRVVAAPRIFQRKNTKPFNILYVTLFNKFYLESAFYL